MFKQKTTLRHLCMLLTMCVGTHVTNAQVGNIESERIAYKLDSNTVHAPNIGRSVCWQAVIRHAGAEWLRVSFDTLQLSGSQIAGTNAVLRIMSFEDGAVQELNATTAREWQNTSAFFNGDTLLLELEMSAGIQPARVQVDSLVVGLVPATDRSICGSEDDRVLWDDPRIARVLGASGSPLCTAWLIVGTGRDLLTAGHCASDPSDCPNPAFSQLSVVEFNVPLSSSDGSPNFADPSDQYSVDEASIQYWLDCDVVGDDWCYFGVFPNSETGADPLWQQGGYFSLPNGMPNADGSTIQISGFGTDNSPLSHNQVQQTEWGSYDVLSNGWIAYDDLDTESGASGSPIELLSQGVAIGIHTNGECYDGGGENYGTAINNAGLQNALANPQGICGAPIFTEIASIPFTVVFGEGRIREVASRVFTVVVGNNRFREIASRAVVIKFDPDWVPPCLEDINGDGYVDVSDLLAIIDQWGQTNSPADVNADGIVDVSDLLIVISNWGECE